MPTNPLPYGDLAKWNLDIGRGRRDPPTAVSTPLHMPGSDFPGHSDFLIRSATRSERHKKC